MTATRLTITATAFDISFAISLTARSFELSEQQIREIGDYISSFYVESLNYAVKPTILCACLLWHMKDSGQIYTTKKRIFKIFKVNQSWLFKKKRNYLEKMGIKLMPPLTQMTASSISGRGLYQ